MKNLSRRIFVALPVMALCLGSQLYAFGQVVITSADIQAGTSVFVFKQPKKFFGAANQVKGGQQAKPKPKPPGTRPGTRPSAPNVKPEAETAPEVIPSQDWINEQADNAIEERKLSDSEPFLSLPEGYLNSRAYFCESPQFPEAARKAKKKMVSSKVLVTVAKYGGLLQATTIEGDDIFRANVYNSLGSMSFRQSYFMGKPIRIEGMLNFTQNPANTMLCRETTKDVEVPAIIEGGVLNEHLTACEFPEFPAGEKETKIQVVIDEQGKVGFAKQLDGNSAFGEAAAKSAMKATFPRSSIAGKPVKVRGVLVFTQSADGKMRCGAKAE